VVVPTVSSISAVRGHGTGDRGPGTGDRGVVTGIGGMEQGTGGMVQGTGGMAQGTGEVVLPRRSTRRVPQKKLGKRAAPGAQGGGAPGEALCGREREPGERCTRGGPRPLTSKRGF